MTDNLIVETRNRIAIVTLNRPALHNAFDDALIDALTAAFVRIDADAEVRAMVLLGAGKSFCAGADLNWMKRMAGYNFQQNYRDAMGLATMLKTLNGMKKPTIARVHGAAYGGGAGLVAACDIAVGSFDAEFCFSEARLGLAPATIAPYVLDAIGPRYARRYFLSAERFSAAEAYRIGLLSELAAPGELDATINELCGHLLQTGPAAQAAAKDLVRAMARGPLNQSMIEDSASRIATLRVSPEGKEGIGAFLDKRQPAWTIDNSKKPRRKDTKSAKKNK